MDSVSVLAIMRGHKAGSESNPPPRVAGEGGRATSQTKVCGPRGGSVVRPTRLYLSRITTMPTPTPANNVNSMNSFLLTDISSMAA